jgi:Predicted nucleic acid-binding protein, contains PIN domain
MDAVFADTFYFLALLNERDAAHDKATQFGVSSPSLVTTAWVLTEVADAFSMPENRSAFLELLDTLKGSPDVRIVGPGAELFNRGIDLFRQRSDKERSLTDCISFVTMADAGIPDALTGDRHFEQAGFRALLK